MAEAQEGAVFKGIAFLISKIQKIRRAFNEFNSDGRLPAKGVPLTHPLRLVPHSDLAYLIAGGPYGLPGLFLFCGQKLCCLAVLSPAEAGK